MMSGVRVAQMERVLISIFDIAASAEKSAEQQADFIRAFLNSFSSHIADLADLHPDRLLTGTGAIVQIGRGCAVDAVSTRRLMEFAVGFASGLCEKGIPLRTAINYSEGDQFALGTKDLFGGSYIQLGDTIHTALNTLAFCEPCEIIVAESVRDLLRHHGLDETFLLQRNERLLTKQGMHLDTYTYDCSLGENNSLYSPRTISHPYKRFTTFPPIQAEALQYFLANGLESELFKVVSNAFTAISQINDTKSFLSSSEVLQVLTSTTYDPDDSVLVISRNDRPTGFWTQRRKKQYITFLKEHAANSKGHINQTRIWIYDDSSEEDLMPKSSIFNELAPLHAPKTLFNFPVVPLQKYGHLAQLIFGVTLSTKHGYAIIPTPSTDLFDASRLGTEHIGELLWQHREYDDADGPMKAIITADSSYVATLQAEFSKLIHDPAITCLR
jgi:hypothetical protein